MHVILKILAGVTAAILVIVTGLAAFVYFATGEQVRPLAQGFASAALGRKVTIDRLTINKGWITDITASHLVIANPDWAGDKPMAEIERFAVTLDLSSLLDPQLRIPRLELENGTIDIAYGADDRVNWQSAETAGELAAPEERQEMPAIENLAITGIDVTYRNLETAASETVAITGIEGTLEKGKNVRLSADLDWREHDARLQFNGEQFETLINENRPYNFTLYGDGLVNFAVDGTATKSGNLDILLELNGESLADIGRIIDVPLPTTANFSLKGQLLTAEDRYTLQDFSGTVGRSDLSGTATLELTRDIPKLTGDLYSNRVDFKDLAGLIGNDPDSFATTAETGETAETVDDNTSPNLFSNAAIPTDRLRDAELDLSYNAREIIAPTSRVEELSITAKLADGRLLVRPFMIGIAKGVISGEIAVNAREATPSADIDVALSDISMRDFFTDTDFAQEMGGTLSGALYLIGTGNTPNQIAATAEGGGQLIIRDGKISALIVEAVGLDVVESLGVLLMGDVPLPMPCAGLNFTADHGSIDIEKMMLSTDDSLVVGKGSVDLAQQTLDIQVEGRASDFSLLDISAPINLTGPINDPNIGIGGESPLEMEHIGEDTKVSCQQILGERHNQVAETPD